MVAPTQTSSMSIPETSKTLGFIVDECLPLRAVNLEFHDSSYESITLNPTKLTNEILRNCKKVLSTSFTNLPRLKLNNLNTQSASPINTSSYRHKNTLTS